MVWFDRAAKLWMVHHAVWLTLFPIVTWNSTYAVIKLPFVWTHPENHCTSLKVTAVLPFQALELMHLLNYVHTLV